MEPITDLVPVLDVLTQLQETARQQLTVQMILCGMVLGAVFVIILHELWGR